MGVLCKKLLFENNTSTQHLSVYQPPSRADILTVHKARRTTHYFW